MEGFVCFVFTVTAVAFLVFVALAAVAVIDEIITSWYKGQQEARREATRRVHRAGKIPRRKIDRISTDYLRDVSELLDDRQGTGRR